MKSIANEITKEQIIEYVENNIPLFHQNRLEKLKKLKLNSILKRKNPYLFKAKNVATANDFIKTILDAFLSSQEEGLFGGFLEGLAIYICGKAYCGRKSFTEGVDLEFEKDGNQHIVSIKSGPNWGNASQVKKMRDNFSKARKIVKTNSSVLSNIVAVNGCCYGQENNPNKGDYFKLCGQSFWEFISGKEDLYIEIIEPLGHKAKEKNEEFYLEYSSVINKFTLNFIEMFCDDDGKILWEELIKFNSKK